MGKTVTRYVDYIDPKTGRGEILAPGDEVPDGVEISNPLAFDEEPEPKSPFENPAPANPSVEAHNAAAAAGGYGDQGDGPFESRKVAQLRAVAAANNVDLSETKTKAEVVQALEDAGVSEG